ncbi:MAG TPA: DUF1579 family protein [Cyclobacteriaceae bacterium]|jgi:hypothetical protein|nr:MAG: hypothetical protein DIU61_02430 [Bacteroidota bacterium]
MKKLITPLLAACLLGFVSANAQAPDFSAQCKERLQKLEALAGKWKGSGTVTMGPGRTETFNQTEDVQFRLDGTILQIEGVGKRGDDVVFNALAVINYDVMKGDYAMKSYLRDGRSTDAWFKVVEDNAFSWGYSLPNNSGQIRYMITLKEAGKVWTEIGEFSSDGTNWNKMFEMNLNKEL